MHLTTTVKSIVLTIAFAMQCVYAKSRNGYAYFDEKFCVLEWIIYLKRLSLIALTLCGLVLYYVPKSRSYARRACCVLIDTIATGLKFALNTNGIEYEKIKATDETDENKELRIQELYRKVYEEDTRDYGQKYNNKTNFDNGNHKSIRKQNKSKKYRTKHHDGKRHRHNRHRNAADVLPESDAAMVSTIHSPQQITIIDDKCQKDNVVIPQNTSLEMSITTYTMSADKLQNNTDLRQEDSLNKKTDSSTVPEIIDKNGTKYKLMKYKTASQKQEDVGNIDIDKKLQSRQNFGYKEPEEIAIASPRQSSKDCATKIMNKQINPRYERLFTKRELCDELRKENRRLPDMKSFTHECYENSPITKDRVKPILLRVVDWLFGGCPEASRRQQEQVEEVGKEEIFKSTNMWLPETSELYLQQ